MKKPEFRASKEMSHAIASFMKANFQSMPKEEYEAKLNEMRREFTDENDRRDDWLANCSKPGAKDEGYYKENWERRDKCGHWFAGERKYCDKKYTYHFLDAFLCEEHKP